jgi:hypothetical protein
MGTEGRCWSAQIGTPGPRRISETRCHEIVEFQRGKEKKGTKKAIDYSLFVRL